MNLQTIIFSLQDTCEIDGNYNIISELQLYLILLILKRMFISLPSKSDKREINTLQEMFDNLIGYNRQKDKPSIININSVQDVKLKEKVQKYNSYVTNAKKIERQRFTEVMQFALAKDTEQQWAKKLIRFQELRTTEYSKVWTLIERARQLTLFGERIQHFFKMPLKNSSILKNIVTMSNKVVQYEEVFKQLAKFPCQDTKIQKINKQTSKDIQDLRLINLSINKLSTALTQFRDKKSNSFDSKIISDRLKYYLDNPIKNLVDRVNKNINNQFESQKNTNQGNKYLSLCTILNNLSIYKFDINEKERSQTDFDYKEYTSLISIGKQLQLSLKKSSQINDFMKQQFPNLKLANIGESISLREKHGKIYQNLLQIQSRTKSLVAIHKEYSNNKVLGNIELVLKGPSAFNTTGVRKERTDKIGESTQNSYRQLLQQISKILGIERNTKEPLLVRSNTELKRRKEEIIIQISRLKNAEMNFQQKLNMNSICQFSGIRFSNNQIAKNKSEQNLQQFQNKYHELLSQNKILKQGQQLIKTQMNKIATQFVDAEEQYKKYKQQAKVKFGQYQHQTSSIKTLVSEINVIVNSINQLKEQEKPSNLVQQLKDLKVNIQIIKDNSEKETIQRIERLTAHQQLIGKNNLLITSNTHLKEEIQNYKKQNELSQKKLLQFSKDISNYKQQISELNANITNIKENMEGTERKLQQCQTQKKSINEQLEQCEMRIPILEKNLEQLTSKQSHLDEIVKSLQLKIQEKDQKIDAIQQKYRMKIQSLSLEIQKLSFLQMFQRKSCIYQNKSIEASVKRALLEIQAQNDRKIEDTSLLFRYTPSSKPVKSMLQGKCHNFIIIKFTEGRHILAYVSIPLSKSKTETINQQQRGFIIIENQQKQYFCTLKQGKQAVQYNNFGSINIGKSDLRLQFGVKGSMSSNIGYNTFFDSQNKKMKQMLGTDNESFEQLEIFQLHFSDPNNEITQKYDSTITLQLKPSDDRISQEEIQREQQTEKERQFNSLKQQLQTVRQGLKEEQQQRNILQKQIKDKENQIQKLTAKTLAKLPNVEIQLQNMKRIFKTKQGQANQLQEKIEQKDVQIKALLGNIHKISENLKRQSEKCQMIEKQNADSNSKAKIVSQKYQSLLSTNQQQENTILNLREEIELMLGQISNRENQEQLQKRDQNIQTNQLKLSNQKLQEELQNERVKTRQFELNCKKMETLSKENQKITMQLQAKCKELQSSELLREKCSKLEEQKNENNLQATEISLKYSSLLVVSQNQSETINKLEAEVESLSKKITDQRNKLHQQQNTAKIHQQQIIAKMNKLNKLIAEQKDEIKHLKAKVRELETSCSEAEYLKLENQRLTNQVQQKSQKQNNYQQLELLQEQKTKNLQIKVKQKDQQIKKLQQNVKTIKQQLKQYIEKCQMIERPKEMQANQKNLTLQQENNSFRSINQQLKAKIIMKQLQIESMRKQTTTSSKIKTTSKNINQQNIKQIIREQLQKQFFQSFMNKLSLFQSQEYKQILTNYQKQYNPMCLLYISQLFQGELIESLPLYKYKICYHLQKLQKSPIIRTRLLYKFDTKNKTNFHEYIDNQYNLLLIAKTVDDAYIVGYYSGKYCESIMTDPGLLISLHNNEVFQLNTPESNPGKQTTYKAMQYDKYYAIFGNAEIRIKTGENKVFSNFGIMNSYYNHRLKKVSEFLRNESKREVELESYEFYQVIFQQRRKQQ